jgi:lysozyme family protein
MSTEILKQALEKIARVNACDYEYQAWAREALNHIPDAKKMVQGEPVAFLVYDPRVQSQELYFDDELGDMDCCVITPLYATPQQRKPLTDDEIWKFWWNKPEVQDGEDDSMEAQFVAAVRAVLAAHGIGVNK